MSARLTTVLGSKDVQKMTEEQVSRILFSAPKADITAVYTKLHQYVAMYGDTVVCKRYAVLKKCDGSAEEEIAVKLAKEEIVFYFMCEKFRGEDSNMECDRVASQGVKRRGSKRTSSTKAKKYKLDVE